MVYPPRTVPKVVLGSVCAILPRCYNTTRATRWLPAVRGNQGLGRERAVGDMPRVAEEALVRKMRTEIDQHLHLFEQMRAELLPGVLAAGRLLWKTLAGGGKILAAGNGGSAADAQHFAAELVGRYLRERQAQAAIALTTDTSILTAVGNDYGFDQIFSRQVAGLGRSGDTFLAISTSGNSRNLLVALQTAREKGLTTLALLGKGGGAMKDQADHALVVPSGDTPRIQEGHQWIWHTWCDIIDSLCG